MPKRTIEIEQSTFERLQSFAIPLEDTNDSVLNRALDALERQKPNTVPVEEITDEEYQIDFRVLPNLKHTKVLEASILGQRVPNPSWNHLLELMIVCGMQRLRSYYKLSQICQIGMVQGREVDKGYRYLAEIDISVQGQNSNSACQAMVAVADQLGIALEVKFIWRDKIDAEHPGMRARLNVPANLSYAE